MRKALLIGIDYTSVPEVTLKGCVDDTINIRNMLLDAYNYDLENIKMLRDDETDPSKIPTGENILNSIRAIVEESANLEEIWIHYSGHGSQIPDYNSVKHHGVDDIIIPLNFKTHGPIRDSQLFNLIKEIKCRAILVFDCCHSGTVCDLQWSFEYVGPTYYTRTMVDDMVISNPNIYMFSGCKDDQTSADTYSPVLKQAVGAFTNAFIECLRKNHHSIDILILYREICRKLANDGYQQRPIFSSSCMEPNYQIKRVCNENPETIFNRPYQIDMLPFNLVQ